ncbi:MAG TPA: glycine cleavage system protein GcvH [Gammaproteobacteria bacterium]|nr:glycine cleavage system protein H [Gammaproteobacteria bacterium]MEC8010626.1 glycine cleavage system protein GcvH [Pseudomonadota bacterium]HBF07433.1 glycine cleavage system protein GcvH [Gammaproteobacteria bacterium]HCK91602.1 glycine cleavage system protein GcvH [Gammaproteobacteria bacterium]|tara:strand:- start:854 stop:1246 length:393 start_codon:yes stop_codon:yes gene_type:complete
MSNCPNDLKYTQSHEWIRIEDNIATIGITDHAQSELGDLVYVELPEEGAEFEQGDEAGVVESVKTASDIYAPLSGKVIAVNELLEDAPESINNDAYGDGWIFQLELSDATEVDSLLDADDYEAQIESDDE